MRQIYLVLALALLSSSHLRAQLQPGDWATPFTLNSIDGEEQRLYDFLADGKPVIMVMSAAWCAPCWALHTSGVLEEIWETHGPGGSDEVRILFVEADPNTSFEQLTGQEGPSQGNWVMGTPFPMIDVETFQLPAAYGLQAFPTVVLICPDMRVQFPQLWGGLGSWTVDRLLQNLLVCDETAPLVQDAAVHTFDVGGADCYAGNISAKLFNSGSAPLTQAQVELRRDGQLLDTYEWTGLLNLGDEAVVTFENVPLLPARNNFTIELPSADEDDSNNKIAVPFFKAPNTLLELIVYSQGDENAEAHNTRWAVLDESETVVASGTLLSNEYQEESISLPAEGCYTFAVYDDGGDGLASGSFVLATDIEGRTIIDANVFDDEISRLFLAESVVSTQATDILSGLSIFPNPAADEVQLQLLLKEGSSLRLSWHNSMGQALGQRQILQLPAGQHQLPLDLSLFPKGLYYLRVDTDAGTFSRKLIKQ